VDPVVLSLMEQPWNESFELVWDDANGEVVAIVVAGAHTAVRDGAGRGQRRVHVADDADRGRRDGTLDRSSPSRSARRSAGRPGTAAPEAEQQCTTVPG
jgi:hypothetical protein